MASSSLILSRRDLDFLLHEWLDVEALTKRPRFTEHSRETFDAVLDLAAQVATDHFAPHNRTADENEPRMVDGKVVLVPEVGRALEVFARDRAHGRHVRRGVRRHAAAAHRRAGGAGLVPGGQHRHVGLPVPHHGQRAADPGARQPRADRHLRRPHGRGPLVRHDGAVRAAGRLLARRHHHQGRAPGRRQLPAHRQQDVDLRRRPRAHREHRAPGAGQGPRRPGRREGHLAVRRPQVPRRGRRHARGAQRRRPGRAQPQDGLPGDDEHAAQLRRGRAHPRRAGRRGRLPRGRGEPRPHLHVPHDERGADRRRGGRLGARLHRLPARPRLRAHPHAGPARRREGPRLPHGADHRAPRRPPDAAGRQELRRGRAGAGAVLRAAGGRGADRRRAPTERDRAHLLLDTLTPIAKAWPSQWGLAANDLAIQVHGGYGYTRDYPVEQFYRDNRLNPIHEGTQGIQALDLLGRKVVLQGGAGLRAARRRRSPRRRRGPRAPSGRGSPPTSTRRSPGWPRSPRRCGAPATPTWRWPTRTSTWRPPATSSSPGCGWSRRWPPARARAPSTRASAPRPATSGAGSCRAPARSSTCSSRWTARSWTSTPPSSDPAGTSGTESPWAPGDFRYRKSPGQQDAPPAPRGSGRGVRGRSGQAACAAPTGSGLACRAPEVPSARSRS